MFWLLSVLSLSSGLINVERNEVDTVEEATHLVRQQVQSYADEPFDDKFVIFTVASDDNDPYQRYKRSLRVFNMERYLKVSRWDLRN